jgi:gamma-glutamyltranspeptidase/glutathione hydrolase
MALGGAGGPTASSQVLLTIISLVDFGVSAEAAIQQPRFHHQGNPDELRIENTAGEAVLADLTRRGFQVVPVDSLGVLQLVTLQPGGKAFVGVSDPRGEGAVTGF